MIKTKIHINLDDDVKFILNELQKYGQGYIVGGFLRDYIFLLENKDVDFSTSLSSDKVCEIFKNFNPQIIGQHFQVVMITVNSINYEIARFRQDIYENYENRKSVLVEFSDNLEEDLNRRDFVFNAMAYDGEYLYQINELDKNSLEFVGDKSIRLKEDPLRLLRGIRFLDKLKLYQTNVDVLKSLMDFQILNTLSKERIRDEIIKIFSSQNLNETLEYFNFLLMYSVFPKNYNTYQLKLAYYFTLYYTYNSTKLLLTEYKFSNKDINYILKLYRAIINTVIPNDKNMLSKIMKFNDISDDDINIILNGNYKIDKPYKISHLDIKGNELPDTIKENERGIVLKYLLSQVMKGNCINKKDDLICCLNNKDNIIDDITLYNSLEFSDICDINDKKQLFHL